jgi:diaminopimelate epimerase
MRFAKGHGTENDFVIIPDPDDRAGMSAVLAARLCDRRAGLGADGVLRVVRTAALAAGSAGVPGPLGTAVPVPESEPEPESAEWFMDYRNADGSVAEMCGNGLRVFARFLLDHGMAAGPAFTVATRAGLRRVRVEPGGSFTADMGPVSVLGPGRAVSGGIVLDGLRISVGNPHLACLVDVPLDKFDLSAPPEIDPGQFPAGANVELVQLTGPGALAMRVHERGSGETRSCGTGAVAAAVAAATVAAPLQATGTDRPGSTSWQVHVPGGELCVTLDATTSWLTGPAVIVAEGDLDPAWLAGAQR